MKKLALLITVITVQCSILNAQETKKENAQQQLATAIQQQRYIFNAQSASPTGGGTRQLTSEYNFKVVKDSVQSYLPYFGRAYAAPMPSDDGGIKFTSVTFDYTIAEGKKGGWTISIKPKDANDVREVTISISKNGYGTVQVISNTRQPISFYGQVNPLN